MNKSKKGIIIIHSIIIGVFILWGLPLLNNSCINKSKWVKTHVDIELISGKSKTITFNSPRDATFWIEDVCGRGGSTYALRMGFKEGTLLGFKSCKTIKIGVVYFSNIKHE